MGRRMQFVLACGLILILGIGAFEFFGPRFMPSRYVIRALAMEGTPDQGIRSSFLVRKAGPIFFQDWRRPIAWEEGITSKLYGGACIVASADDLGVRYLRGNQAVANRCETDKDCDFDSGAPGGNYGQVANTGNWVGYCHPVEKSCWIKPRSLEHDKSVCRKSVHEDPAVQWPLGVPQPIPTNPAGMTGEAMLELLPPDRTEPVRLRSIGCLQKDGPEVPGGCATRGPNILTHWGPPTAY